MGSAVVGIEWRGAEEKREKGRRENVGAKEKKGGKWEVRWGEQWRGREKGKRKKSENERKIFEKKKEERVGVKKKEGKSGKCSVGK